MKKYICFLVLLSMFSINLFSQEAAGAGYTGQEIENTVAAVKNANPGDYILLKSGKRYVLTREEIEIARGSFNFDDLSGVRTELRDDGTEVKTLSEGHVVYVYPDGQLTHLLKTGASFSSFMNYISNRYYLALYMDFFYDFYESIPITPRSFDVFRATVEFQTISDGLNEMQSIYVSAYNYRGENFAMRYTSEPDMIWGNIPASGSYRPTGESRQIEFDVE